MIDLSCVVVWVRDGAIVSTAYYTKQGVEFECEFDGAHSFEDVRQRVSAQLEVGVKHQVTGGKTFAAPRLGRMQ